MDAGPISSSTTLVRRRSAALLTAVAVVMVIVASGCVVNGTWTPLANSAPGAAGIACVTDAWCMAGGGPTGVQVWNGSTWTSRPAPASAVPAVPADVKQIECFAVDRCLADVQIYYHLDDDSTHYLFTWNGTAWTEAPGVGTIDVPGSARSMSCAADGCAVLDGWPRMITWDGSSITTQDAFPAFVETMDCVTTDDCLGLAAGSAKHWDGTAWTPVPGVGAHWDDWVYGEGMQCPTTTQHCVAFGIDLLTSARMAGVWNGSAWTTTPLPTGVTAIVDLSCVASLECVAAGYPHTVLTFNGQQWFVAPTPPGGPNASYWSISCVAQSCLATGTDGASPSTPLFSRYAWTYP